MTNETLLSLLQFKLDYLNSISNACMLWWVSSIVFCGYIIYAVWTKKEEIQNIPNIHWFFFMLFFFFLSIVIFGGWTIYTTTVLQHETSALLIQLNSPASLPFEFEAIKISILIGTSSFVLVLITWCAIWLDFAKKKYKVLKRKQGIR